MCSVITHTCAIGGLEIWPKISGSQHERKHLSYTTYNVYEIATIQMSWGSLIILGTQIRQKLS